MCCSASSWRHAYPGLAWLQRLQRTSCRRPRVWAVCVAPGASPMAWGRETQEDGTIPCPATQRVLPLRTSRTGTLRTRRQVSVPRGLLSEAARQHARLPAPLPRGWRTRTTALSFCIAFVTRRESFCVLDAARLVAAALEAAKHRCAARSPKSRKRRVRMGRCENAGWFTYLRIAKASFGPSDAGGTRALIVAAHAKSQRARIVAPLIDQVARRLPRAGAPAHRGPATALYRGQMPTTGESTRNCAAPDTSPHTEGCCYQTKRTAPATLQISADPS